MNEIRWNNGNLIDYSQQYGVKEKNLCYPSVYDIVDMPSDWLWAHIICAASNVVGFIEKCGEFERLQYVNI